MAPATTALETMMPTGAGRRSSASLAMLGAGAVATAKLEALLQAAASGGCRRGLTVTGGSGTHPAIRGRPSGAGQRHQARGGLAAVPRAFVGLPLPPLGSSGRSGCAHSLSLRLTQKNGRDRDQIGRVHPESSAPRNGKNGPVNTALGVPTTTKRAAGDRAHVVTHANPGPARHSSWASWSSATAVAPSPSSAIVSGVGCNWLNGRSGWAVTTPEPSGYSYDWEWAMIS
jgi:hypothetical protein